MYELFDGGSSELVIGLVGHFYFLGQIMGFGPNSCASEARISYCYKIERVYQTAVIPFVCTSIH